MKKYFFLICIIILLVGLSKIALAQFPFWFGPPNPFFSSWSPLGLFAPSFSIFPPLLPMGPFPSAISPPRTSLSLLSPIRMPQPLLRQAAATITIFFNPTLSVIQVTVLPISPLAPAPAPVTAVAPTVAPPALGLTALALLPLLSGITGPTQTKTLTRLSTTAPTVPVLTGITGLLPLI